MVLSVKSGVKQSNRYVRNTALNVTQRQVLCFYALYSVTVVGFPVVFANNVKPVILEVDSDLCVGMGGTIVHLR